MSTLSSTPYDWSLQAIPAVFVLGLLPHFYFVMRMQQATKGQMSASIPRTNLESWKGQLSTEVWNSLAKARGAHLNSMEVFPLFAAAMVAGNLAQIPVQERNSMALSFLGARILYIALYMGVKSNTLSYARTGAYFWGISIPLMGLWRAGQANQTT